MKESMLTFLKGKVQIFMGNLYQSCDFYMLRTPLLPVEFYQSICFLDDTALKDELIRILETKEIREAIQAGSSSLYNKLEQMNNKVSSSVMKYLIRMSTRTTPYGLFSGINIGRFDTYSSIRLDDKKNFKKRMRPDMGWLYGVINTIENNPRLLKSIKVKKNNLVYKKGDRLENPYVSNLGLIEKKEGETSTSIKWTNLLNVVMESTQGFIKIKELVHIILEKYPEVKEEKITNYIVKLIQYEYLITSLRPPLTETNLFEYVINQVKELENSNELYGQLDDIAHKINTYNTQAIGDSQDLLSNIVKDMDSLYNTNNYLQIDMGISTRENVLNQCIRQDMEEYCEMLQKLTASQLEDYSMKAYKEEFIEKYGLDVEVQLLELLDEGVGLGAPAGYTNPMSHRKNEPGIPNEKVKRIKEFLNYKIIESNATHNEFIQLTDEDIEVMSGGSDVSQEEFSPSVEFNAIISAKSCEDVDKGNYLLFIGPNFGSIKAGKTFGRFMDIIDEQDARRIKSEIYEKEKAVLNDKYVMVELSELLQFGRGNNVTINSNNIEHQLCIATNSDDAKKTIDIQDLYVGVSNNKFYVKSKSLNKKLFITYHHMMNHRNGSNLGRFLKDVTFSYYTNLLDVALMFQIENFEHIPRVMYRNIVMIPTSWKIKKEKFDVSSYEKFEESFKDWVKKNKVPRYIYQKENDNRLMLDLSSTTHTKELFRIIQKANDAVIITETEVGQDMDRFIVYNEHSNNKYCCEVVIPLIRKTVNTEKNKKDDLILESIWTKSIVSRNKNKISIQDKSRNLFPGDENWYYYKLYTTEIRINELIGDYLYDFCEMLIEKGFISKYFFIRYADPKIHIRIRVQVTDGNDHLVQQHFNEFLKQLHAKGLVNSMQIENYVREIERYGGAEIMRNAEDYFYADSQYIGQLIKFIRKKELNYTDEQLGIISIISILEQFNVTFGDQDQLFRNIIDRSEYRDYYKKNRKEFMQFANWEEFCNVEIGSVLFDLIKRKQEKTVEYRQAIDSLDQQGNLSNSKTSILLSIIHMFCNRFKGDREWERLIMAMVGHSLYDLKSYKVSQMKKVLVNSYD